MIVHLSRRKLWEHESLVWYSIPLMAVIIAIWMTLSAASVGRKSPATRGVDVVRVSYPPVPKLNVGALQDQKSMDVALPKSLTAATAKPHCQFCLARDLWKGIESLKTEGEPAPPAKALELWKNMRLSKELESWRHLAIGAIHLQTPNLPQASASLERAAKLDLQNPVVHFYHGVMWLKYSAASPNWENFWDPSPMFWAALRDDATDATPSMGPFSRTIYRTMAKVALENSIRLKSQIWLDQPLIGQAWAVPKEFEMEMPLVSPTARDLLRSLGTANYVGMAHRVLGQLYMEDGGLQQSEQHLDQAAKLGFRVGDAYRELATKLEKAGDWAGAMRLDVKSMFEGAGPKKLYDQPKIKNLY